MNTPQDRANRIMAWGTRGRDLLWIMTMILISHVLALSLIGAGYESTYLPLTVFLVFFTILGIMGSFDAMDDIKAVADDADNEERGTAAHKRFMDTPWLPFKALIFLGFALTALAELWVMWG
ncbi:MAG: hypothetical protein ACPGRH_06390 [Alphaproteobacteria bacterium]